MYFKSVKKWNKVIHPKWITDNKIHHQPMWDFNMQNHKMGYFGLGSGFFSPYTKIKCLHTFVEKPFSDQNPGIFSHARLTTCKYGT